MPATPGVKVHRAGADDKGMPPIPVRARTGDAEARLAHLAYHDPLTGLPNRSRLGECLADALARAARTGGAVAVLSVDLDDFKLVNDGLGHAAGDALLRQVASRLEQARRAADAFGRQGGDEFLLILGIPPGTDARGAAQAAGDRILECFEAPFAVGEAELRIGASVGAARFPADASDAETLHRHADAAMYAAKAAGGGYAAYHPRPGDPLRQLSLAARLRRAMQEDAFELHFQPIWRLATGDVLGVEALVRWRDGPRGLVPPDEFIPAAEKTGVIEALGDWVLEAVCRQARAWDAEGLHPKFGVNVSPRQLRRAGFAASVTRTVAGHGLAPERFVLELTESAWTLEASRTLPALEELRAAGFMLALDDFGAGYSSLRRLRTLPVDVVKIDRGFMDGLPEDPQAVAVIDAIAALADACGCDVVAEGVETAAQHAFLAGRGCGLAQGYHLGRPEPAAAAGLRLHASLAGARRV